MLEGYPLEIALTAANSAAQAWYGYDQGVVSGILISPDFIKTFPRTKKSSIQGITASCFSLGNLLGCLMAAIYGGHLGRKNTLRIGATISVVGAVLQFSSFSFAQLIVGRVINGVGNGMTSSTCGIFQAESCAGHRRGKLSVIVVLHNVVFYCLATWLTLACSFADGGYQWRLPLALQCVPCAFLMSLLPLVPESPRWLLMKDRNDEALEAIRRYAGKGLSASEPAVQSEYRSIKGALLIEQQTKTSFRIVLSGRDRSGHLKRLLLGCGGQFMQQFGGINALNYYFTIILTTNVGLGELLARILTGCNATSYMISSACCFWMIDRFGRRPLMLTGLTLQSLAYVIVAIAIGLLAKAPYELGIVAVSFLFFYYAVFGCTWGMVPWVYQSEVNSLAMRTVGSAAATSTNWLFGFVCTQFTPTGIQNIGYRFYIIFAVFNLAFIFVVYFLYPETANRTLEDLDAYFDKDSGHGIIIPIGDKQTKSTERPQEAIDAEASRVAMAANVDSKVILATEHEEDVGRVV
ncbi:General substrate transporter [Niveomyces insectorum RCEF 264]|uniref:General substrate transporter n=1 Tax=Niveomyces insectorum RCEF 264 TaxID=1081102 RepID=A0A168ACS1_9HYPO|nr:General substrate transporter [Niveomyces insectorum RCEF 264]